MTRARNYNARCPLCGVDALCPICGRPVSSATPYSDWLRKQREIDSSKGYVASNIDYVWANYETGRWIYMEEKRYGGIPTPSQVALFHRLDNIARADADYGGFWVITFERTTPDDGRVWVYRLGERGGVIDRNGLIQFLLACGEMKQEAVI